MAAKKAAEKSGKKAGKKPAKAQVPAAVKSTRGAASAAPSKKQQRATKKATPNAALVATTYAKLRARHSDAHCELDHDSPFQLILATVLSAQSTDVMVNKITPELFERWPTPAALSNADPAEVERVLSKIGMYRQKTKNVIGLSKRLVDEHQGQVPRTLAELVKLPGVGRKTANVVLGVAFGTPEGVVVDTHVQRISQRLGWTKHSEPQDIERDLMALFPRSDWDMLSHTLIFHGRRVCAARKPACAACPVSAECPSAFAAENVGRKKPNGRSRPAKQ
ncbi:MAG TPA: endonuclease III [Polyangiaceae bacterium]|nr:endonuclease III [Polyangiaceae bacterium]